MYALYCILTQEETERIERKGWEMYTANAMCAIANALGYKLQYYSDILNDAQQAQNTETVDDVLRGLLAIL